MCHGQDSVRIYTTAFCLSLEQYHDRVLAQVDGKMVKPPPERPLEGIISIHSELSPMASNEYEPGR